MHTRAITQNRLSSGYTVLDGEDFLKSLEFGKKELGRSNARVFEARNRQDSTRAALKEIHLSDESDTSAVLKEVNLLKKIQEKDFGNYFVKFLGFCVIREDRDAFNSETTAYILMEKAHCCLTKLVDTRRRNAYVFHYFGVDEVLRSFRFLIDAFAFLQKDLAIAHCDIKPENLLVMHENELEFKVCDVGAGEILMNDKHTKTKTIKGTIPFLAPELSNESLLSKKNRNFFKADVFSLGLCFIYIITFRKFSKSDRQVLNDEVFQEILWEWINEAGNILNNEDLKGILKEMLEIDPQNRPDFRELQEKWLMAFPLKSPTISEDTNNRTRTFNDELVSNSFVADNEEGSSPERKNKKFVVKKKIVNKSVHLPNSINNFPSLQNTGQNTIINNTSNFTTANSTLKESVFNPLKELKGPAKPLESSKGAREDSIGATNRSTSKSVSNGKALSPVKAFKQPPKLSMEENSEDVSPISPESKKGVSPNKIPNGTLQKSYHIQLKDPHDSEDGRSPETCKKSAFGKKSLVRLEKVEKSEPILKKTHQKFISNGEGILLRKGSGPLITNKVLDQTRNSQHMTPRELNNISNINEPKDNNIVQFSTPKQPNFPSSVFQRPILDPSNFTSNRNPAYFSENRPEIEFYTHKDPNKDHPFFSTYGELEGNFPKTEANHIRNNKELHFATRQDKEISQFSYYREGFYSSNKDLYLLEINANTDLKKKKNTGVALPPLISTIENNYGKPINNPGSHSGIRNNIVRKKIEFRENSRRTLIVNKASLTGFLKNIERNKFVERRINLVLDQNIDEKEALSLFAMMGTLRDLKSLTVDIYFTHSICQSLLDFLEKCIEISEFSLIYREKIGNDSPLKYNPSHIIPSHASSFSLSKLNQVLLNFSGLTDLTLNFDKSLELSNFDSLLKNFNRLTEITALKLSLRGVNLTNHSLSEILNELSNHGKLQCLELFLENNLIDHVFFLSPIILPQSLKKISLSFGFNSKLDLTEIKNNPFEFPSNLETLNLDFEGVCLSNFLTLLTPEIGKLVKLKSLQLGLADCKLQTGDLTEFSGELAKLKMLETLDLNLKNNVGVTEICVVNLCKTIRSNFQNLRCLELNFLYIEISLATVKSILNIGNYMSCLKLEFLNLFMLRNLTQKVVREGIVSSNKDYKLEVCIAYPDLKEMKIFTRVNREKKDSLLPNVFFILYDLIYS